MKPEQQAAGQPRPASADCRAGFTAEENGGHYEQHKPAGQDESRFCNCGDPPSLHSKDFHRTCDEQPATASELEQLARDTMGKCVGWIETDTDPILPGEREKLTEIILESYAKVQELTRKEHKCALPDSINEALNSGDGVYRP